MDQDEGVSTRLTGSPLQAGEKGRRDLILYYRKRAEMKIIYLGAYGGEVYLARIIEG